MPDVQIFQGGAQLATVPNAPGLYAWYYRPKVINRAVIATTLGSFLEAPGELSAVLTTRYGVRWAARAAPVATFGQQQLSAAEVVGEALEGAEDFLEEFFTSSAVLHFTRPLYIGIAKNLYERIYVQHYQSLVELYEPKTAVSRYLNANPNVSAAVALEQLALPHTFALDARVRRLPPRDLMVCVYPVPSPPSALMIDDDATDDPTPRRSLERVLQLVADPVCGRR